MDKKSLAEVQTGKSLQEKIKRIKEERPIHIQIKWYWQKLNRFWKRNLSSN